MFFLLLIHKHSYIEVYSLQYDFTFNIHSVSEKKGLLYYLQLTEEETEAQNMYKVYPEVVV